MLERKLKIAQISPIWTPVPPKKYGGTERIVSYVTEELIRRGHDVTLFASGDSKTKAKLVSIWPNALIKEKIGNKPIPWSNKTFTLLHLSKSFRGAKEFDIIHVHENSACLSNFFIPLTNVPSITTIHDPLPKKPTKDIEAFFKFYKNHNYISISRSHQNLWKKRFRLNFAANIYNGVDVESFQFREKEGDYMIWLGRFAPNKGAKEAIRVAKKANINLRLAGRIDENSPVSVEYFKKEISPYIDKSKGIEFVGEVGKSSKINLLKNAKALLFPIKWEEPFGLVMIEAMACGTPVIAFNRGSVPEIVKDGETGFIVKNEEQMVKAIEKIDRIKRVNCRKWVENNFSISKMVDNYEEAYHKIIGA